MFHRIDFGKIPPHDEDFFELVTSYLSTLFSFTKFSQKRKKITPFSDLIRRMNRFSSQHKLTLVDTDDVVKSLISESEKMLEHTDSEVLNVIIKQRRKELMEFIEEADNLTKDDVKRLDKEAMHVHLIFDLLREILPFPVLDKMSKLNPQIPEIMESSYLAIKYAMRENLH